MSQTRSPHPNPCVTWEIPPFPHASPAWKYAHEVFALAPKHCVVEGKFNEMFRVRRILRASYERYLSPAAYAAHAERNACTIEKGNCKLDLRTCNAKETPHNNPGPP